MHTIENCELMLVLSTRKRESICNPSIKLELVADPVIEVIARLEFEDGLRMGVLLGGCWGP